MHEIHAPHPFSTKGEQHHQHESPHPHLPHINISEHLPNGPHLPHLKNYNSTPSHAVHGDKTKVGKRTAIPAKLYDGCDNPKYVGRKWVTCKRKTRGTAGTSKRSQFKKH